MNITLRKANAIQNSINEAIRAIEIKTVIELNEFQDIGVELKKANDTLFANDGRRQKLLLALYNIRGLVGTANANSGIDLTLAKAAFIDKRLTQIETLAHAGNVVGDISVITGKLEKLKATDAKSRLYGYNDTVSTGVIGQEQLDQIKGEILNLKKQKQKLNDELLELNIKTEVPLSDDVVATLREEGLI